MFLIPQTSTNQTRTIYFVPDIGTNLWTQTRRIEQIALPNFYEWCHVSGVRAFRNHCGARAYL